MEKILACLLFTSVGSSQLLFFGAIKQMEGEALFKSEEESQENMKNH